MLMLIAGAMILAIAALGAAGRLPRNYFAGIRIPSTMRSDAAWVAGHRAATAPLSILGVSIMGLGLWNASSSEPAKTGGLLSLVVVVFGTWGVVAAHRAASREL